MTVTGISSTNGRPDTGTARRSAACAAPVGVPAGDWQKRSVGPSIGFARCSAPRRGLRRAQCHALPTLGVAGAPRKASVPAQAIDQAVERIQ